jgi:Protein of unknown function (DUF2950)
MIIKTFASAMLLSAALMFGTMAAPTPVIGATAELESYLGAEPPLFDTPEAAVQAFKDTVAKGNLADMAKLLGLDPAQLEKAEGISGMMDKIRVATAEAIVVEGEDDVQILDLGRQLWPFPFPLVKGEDEKWAFDTVAGLEEIVNRRIGENELTAIETMRLYVDAQNAYAAQDRDADGVVEFAQKLLSSEGATDGLYWPSEQGDGDSPAGPLDPDALAKAKSGDGYFGYKFRILTKQGANVAGGAYDYLINGNMIGGFALIGWPAKYGETGVSTFMVNQAGVVYERDFGVDTENIVSKIKTFNPDNNWDLVED